MLYAQSIVSGLLIGGVYGLIAVGLSTVFGVMKIINFAHGTIMMVGMFVVYYAWRALGVTPYVSLLFVVPLLFLFGVAVQLVLVERVIDAPPDQQLILTMGLSLFLLGGAQLLWGADFRTVDVPYGNAAFDLAGVSVSVPRLVAFVAAGALAGGLFWLLRRTDLGRSIRAVAEQPDAAAAVGINLPWTRALTFGIATGCVGVAGTLLTPFYYVTPQVGEPFTLIAFVVVALGGLGNPAGAFVGGLLVGAIEGLGGALLPGSTKQLLIFIVFLLVLVVRPQGLFGRRVAL
ncbi:branched-chain amino acid ABC transporter permease [Phytohabitans suffuscus]|uniref:Branched-chain amino acid ABC transporter permease n=1 Tax=Phytohabitans suffuscus TaxID=624315 RepID=A0A6F8YV84_9ACTN|nr:branched-chain amino acid ABC transporter permease [Phytohabitans suffuscus]BCB89974.1 branched-chain amino acid ABC transporter permease [Phytohabitans suffuscus]